MEDIISIIVPIYNGERYIQRCVESLKNQTYKNIEIILVDDGSTDKTAQICKELSLSDNRIAFFNQKNSGAGGARNKGIENAQGNIIGFVDCDDWIARDFCEYLHKLLVRQNADIAYCQLSKLSSCKRDVKELPEHICCYNREDMMRKFLRIDGDDGFTSVCRCLYKKNVLKDVKFLAERMAEDIEFSCNAILHANRIVVSNQIKYYYCMETKNVTRKKVDEKFEDVFFAWKQVAKDVECNAPEFLYGVQYNRIRAEFTCLCKAAIYGVDKNFKRWPEDKKKFLKSIKQYKNLVLKYNMSFFKKIIYRAMCIGFSVAKIILWFYPKKYTV